MEHDMSRGPGTGTALSTLRGILLPRPGALWEYREVGYRTLGIPSSPAQMTLASRPTTTATRQAMITVHTTPIQR